MAAEFEKPTYFSEQRDNSQFVEDIAEQSEILSVEDTGEFTVPGLYPERVSHADAVLANLKVHFVALMASLGGLLYGYDTGIISGSLLEIKHEWNLSNTMQECVTTAILIGAVCGAFISGKSSKYFGRRRTVLYIALVFFFGVLSAASSPNPTFLIVSRFFLGLAVGGSSQIIPTYIAELVPAQQRGRLVTLFNISLGFGIFLANIINRIFASETGQTWRFTMGIACVPAAILAFAMLKLPETPRWLLEQGEVSEARLVLRDLRPSRPLAVEEVKQIQEYVNLEHEDENAEITLRTRWIRPAIVAGLGVAVFTQLSGLEMMIYYAPSILTQASFSSNYSLWAAVGIAVVYLIFTIFGESIVDRLGRRSLMLWMIPGAALSLIAFGAIFYFQAVPNKLLTIVLLLLYMAFNAGGIQVVGWLLGSELYPLAIKDIATSVHAAALWGANILATSTCLTLVDSIGMSNTMWMYGVFNIVSWIYVLFLVPETKGRTLEEITESLLQSKFYPFQQRREQKV